MSKILALIAAAAVVLSTEFVHRQIPTSNLAERDADAFVPKPQFAKLAALGFDAALADFYWLQAVQVVGGQNADLEKYGTHLGRLIDVVTTLDPWVDHPYRFAAMWMSASREDVVKANSLLRRSFEYHPHDWRNRFYLGYNLFFYLGENEEAAKVLEEATHLPGSPRYLPRLVARLRSQSSNLETAAIFLRQLVEEAEDPASVAEYRSALDEIEVERKARFLDRARASYQRLTGRDIRSVDDLREGEHPVLESIPAPWPSSLPDSLAGRHHWEFDESRDQFVSTYYGRRYEVNFHPAEREEIAVWREGSGNSASRGTNLVQEELNHDD